MTLDLFVDWINSAIVFGTVIMLGAVGETLTQKAGNLNLGVPGVMYLGGIGALAGSFFYEKACFDAGAQPQAWLCLIIGLFSALLVGLLAGLLFSFLTITLRANQNVTGLTLTIFGSGVANFFGGSLSKLAGGVGQISVAATSSVFSARIPWISTKLGVVSRLLFNYGWIVFLAVVIAIVMQLFLNKTRTGLNLRAVGENPATADAAGIRVTRHKYVATCVGSMICALGGLFYVMDYTYGTWANDGAIERLGWLAVALVIFTTWKSVNAIWGAYLFGFCYWLYQYIPAEISKALADTFGLAKPTHMKNLYNTLPYLVTIIVLIVVSMRKKRENQGPSALGLPYFREDR